MHECAGQLLGAPGLGLGCNSTAGLDLVCGEIHSWRPLSMHDSKSVRSAFP